MRLLLLATVVFGSGLFAVTSPAQASLSMMVGSTVITDGGAGDNDSRTGVISYAGTVGNFDVNLSTETGTFAASPLYFDLADTLKGTSSGSLTIKLTSTGLTSPASLSQFLTQFVGSFANGSATISAMTYFDASNAAFGTGTALANLTASSTPFSLSSTKSAGGTTPFSLTEVVTVTASGATSFSLDTNVSAVPEPASLTILGGGLAALGLIRRRRA